MSNLPKSGLFKAKPPTSLLGLTLDGSRLEGVVLRRTNGTVQWHQAFSATLSLDPLTADPELVGREIKNLLDSAGVRERACVVGLPLKWALVAHAKLPELSEADAAGFIQMEAERGFPCDVTTLLLGVSRYQTAAGEKHATVIGMPLNHLNALDQGLRAAKLQPVSFSLGITALQPVAADAAHGVLALTIGETNVGLLVTGGGGVAALRTLEGTLENEGGQREINVELVAREVRITLGQLPAEIREAVRRVKIFGPRELAEELAAELQRRFGLAGLTVERVAVSAPTAPGTNIPPEAAISAAFSLAALRLVGRGAALEFLPPRITAWRRFLGRYSSTSLHRAAGIAGAVALLVLGVVLVQYWQLWRLQSRWTEIEPKVRQLDGAQQKIRQYRPWFDDSLRTLSILKQLSEAFPEDGVVTMKTLEIRDQNHVTCSGIARDNQALLRTIEKLHQVKMVSDLKVDQIRGKTPMLFTFDFHWLGTKSD
ncbi:MAG: hypothetical protein WCO56_21125 [Verrucomicrobiota bacterium]